MKPCKYCLLVFLPLLQRLEKHNLVFQTDAADTAITHQTHVIGFAGADAVVLETVAVVALAVVAGAFVGVTRPPDIPRVFLNVHRILIVAG